MASAVARQSADRQRGAGLSGTRIARAAEPGVGQTLIEVIQGDLDISVMTVIITVY